MVSAVSTTIPSYARYGVPDRAAQLLGAIREKNVSLIKEASPEELKATVDPKKRTLLHEAVRLSFEPGVRVLIEAGLDIDGQTTDGVTPLHCAAFQGDGAMVSLLLSSGANSSILTKFGETALHAAANRGHAAAVSVLIRHDKRLAVQANSAGACPIHLAISGEALDVITLLAPLSKDAKTCSGQTPLHIAARSDKKAVVDMLIQAGAVIDCRDNVENTPLHYAARSGAAECVKALLNAGASPLAKNNCGEVPLHIAARYNHVLVIPLLGDGIASKAHNVTGNMKNNDIDRSWAPLHFAAFFGHQEATKALLGLDANMEIADFCGHTPIYIAAYMGKNEVFTLLVEKGASTKIVDPRTGNTLLHVAADHGKVSIVRLIKKLISRLIDVKNARGQTALHAAVLAGKERVIPELIPLLEEKSSEEGWTPLHLAARYGKLGVMRVLIDHGAQIEARDKQGRTPLHVAINYQQEKAAHALIDLGADKEARDVEGKTPLHLAALRGDRSAFDLLIEKGSELAAVAADGSTVAHAASYGANLKIIRKLWLQDTSLFGTSGAPLTIALRDGNYRIVEFLNKRGMTIAPPTGPFDTSTAEGQRDALVYERWHDFQEGKKWQIDTAHFSWKVPLPDEEWPSLAEQWENARATLTVEEEGIEEEEHPWYGLNRLVEYIVENKHKGIPAIPQDSEEKERFFGRIERFLQHIFGMKEELSHDFYLYCMRLDDAGRACGEGWVHGVRKVWIEVVRQQGLLEVPFARDLKNTLGQAEGELVVKEVIALSFAAEDVRQRLFDRMVKECDSEVFGNAHSYGEYMRAFGDIFKLFGYEDPLSDDPLVKESELGTEKNRDIVNSWFAAEYTPCVLLWVAREHLLLQNRHDSSTGWEEWNKIQREDWRSEHFKNVLNSIGLAAYLRFLKVLTPNPSTL